MQTDQAVSLETPKKKNKRRKRFGKSILCHSPAQFTSILKLKAKASGGEVIEIDPADAKASQYNHITNNYKPVELKERWKQLDEKNKVQRDMYSAFCLGNLNTSNHHINRRKCNQNYKTFKPQHDAVIAKLRKDKKHGKQFPACMGI